MSCDPVVELWPQGTKTSEKWLRQLRLRVFDNKFCVLFFLALLIVIGELLSFVLHLKDLNQEEYDKFL